MFGMIGHRESTQITAEKLYYFLLWLISNNDDNDMMLLVKPHAIICL